MLQSVSSAIVLAAAVVGSTAHAAPFVDHFDSYTPGQMPGGPWADISTSISAPTVPSPTGAIIETTGAYGNPTRAFQITRATGTSQGIISPIDLAADHSLTADIRIDAHPSREVYGNWNAAFGFIQDRGVASDINVNPQGLVYVYQQKWWFFGATVFGGNSTEVLLSNALIQPGDWYHVSLNADTTSGQFHISIVDALGEIQVDQNVAIPNWNPLLGRYNRIAAFDGDYAGASVTSGQFTIDNVNYIPQPAVATILLPALLVASRRRPRIC